VAFDPPDQQGLLQLLQAWTNGCGLAELFAEPRQIKLLALRATGADDAHWGLGLARRLVRWLLQPPQAKPGRLVGATGMLAARQVRVALSSDRVSPRPRRVARPVG
jgi:hypothetical protein